MNLQLFVAKGHIGYCKLGQGPRVAEPRYSRNVGINESQKRPQDLPKLYPTYIAYIRQTFFTSYW